jgi:response regulator RpfG family c-di-GMP phosphodiesterase
LRDTAERSASEMKNYARGRKLCGGAAAKLQENMIYAFAGLAENRDENTGNHIKRTAEYVRAIGNALYERGLFPETVTPEYVDDIVRCSPLHDIGKIKIPDAILNKPGKLTPEEFEIIKRHTAYGRGMLSAVTAGTDGGGYMSEAVNIAGCHHERWDGSGYPDGLAGDEIPLSARIMSVADVFDALISKRSYKEPYPFAMAMDMIAEGSGTQFDPTVCRVFLEIRDEIKRISEGLC